MFETGMILPFAGSAEPSGWYFANGQQLDQTADAALYAIFGDTFSNGSTPPDKFLLPDYRGRTPMGASTTYPLHGIGGEAVVTLSTAQIPQHNHTVYASTVTAGAQDSPEGHYHSAGQIDRTSGEPLDKAFIAPADAGTLVAMADGTVAGAGGGLSHNNLSPYYTINYIIKA